MSTTNQPIFPLEVLERIITEDVVGRRGPVPLLSASRALRHCTFRHLFKRLRIRISDTKAIRRLCDIICIPNDTLSRLGGLCRYIRELDITYEVKKPRVPANDNAPTHTSAEDAKDQSATPSFHDFFSQEAVVDMFTKIVEEGLPRTISFNVLNPDNDCSWNSLPAQFRPVFLSLIRLPSLSDLNILHLTNLPPELLQGSHLARFTQLRCGPPHSNPALSGIDIRALSEDYPLLDSLVTDHSFSFLGMKNLFRGLRELKVTNSVVDHIPSSWTLIKYARKTLQDLTIVENSFTNAELLTPSLSILRNLQRFNYHAHRVGPGSLCFHILQLLFNSTAPLNNLQAICIQLDHIRMETENDALALVQPPVWQTLNALLASPHFSALRTFCVKLKFTLPVPPNDQSWPGDFFDVNGSSPGSLAHRLPTDEDWHRIRTASSFSNNVTRILEESFVGIQHSQTVFETSYVVEVIRYRPNGQV